MDKIKKIKKILEKASSLEKNSNFAIAEEFSDIHDKVDLLKEDIDTISNTVDEKLGNISEELKKKLEEELEYEIDPEEIRGEKGDMGECGEKGEKGEKGDPGRDGKDGKDGRDGLDGKDGLDGQNGLPGANGSPDTGEEIVNKINELPTDDSDKKIDASHIKNLPEAVKYYGGSNTDEKVKLNILDPIAGYLDEKLQQGIQAVQFDTTNTPLASAPGLIQWNQTDGTYDMGLLNQSVLQVGQETMFFGKASGAITNGDLCQFAGVQGDHILIKKAVGSEIEANPHYLVGVATENIANGNFGYVTWFGKVNDVYTKTPANQDTADWVAGDILYFNVTTGQMTKTMPLVPNRVITVAAVIKEQTGTSETGKIIVRPTIGTKLQDLDDVNGTALTVSGQIPVWDNTGKYFDFTGNINNYVPYNGATADVDLGDHTLTTGGTQSGQSLITSGLVVNDGGGNTAQDDFRVETVSNANAFVVDASANQIIAGVDVIAPKIIGGNGTTSDLYFQTTTGVGTTGADMHFLVGNNGVTEAMTILNSGNVGIGTTAPTSTLHTNGSVAYAYRAITALRTLDATDYQIDCTANTFTVTLPTAVGITGRVYSIKNSGTGTITIATTSSQTIDGETTQTLLQWDNLKVMSTGSNWIII